jgi:surfactin synthase thioesterase subunit
MTPVELVCFHHAGGGAASFHPLRLALAEIGAEVAFTAVTLPGRESRRDEPRHVDAEACVHELATELARYGGMPTEVLNRPDWLALLMPTVRDDLRICQSHRRTDVPPLPCPLHIVGGLDDPVAPPHTVVAWASYSVQPQPVRIYSGGHFLFRSPNPELVATVTRVANEAARERNLLP